MRSSSRAGRRKTVDGTLTSASLHCQHQVSTLSRLRPSRYRALPSPRRTCNSYHCTARLGRLRPHPPNTRSRRSLITHPVAPRLSSASDKLVTVSWTLYSAKRNYHQRLPALAGADCARGASSSSYRHSYPPSKTKPRRCTSHPTREALRTSAGVRRTIRHHRYHQKSSATQLS